MIFTWKVFTTSSGTAYALGGGGDRWAVVQFEGVWRWHAAWQIPEIGNYLIGQGTADTAFEAKMQAELAIEDDARRQLLYGLRGASGMDEPEKSQQ